MSRKYNKSKDICLLYIQLSTCIFVHTAVHTGSVLPLRNKPKYQTVELQRSNGNRKCCSVGQHKAERCHSFLLAALSLSEVDSILCFNLVLPKPPLWSSATNCSADSTVSNLWWTRFQQLNCDQDTRLLYPTVWKPDVFTSRVMN